MRSIPFRPPIHLVAATAMAVAGFASYQGVDHFVLSKADHPYVGANEPGTNGHGNGNGNNGNGYGNGGPSTPVKHETGPSTSTTVHTEPGPTTSTTKPYGTGPYTLTTKPYEPRPTTSTTKPFVCPAST